MAKWNAAQTAPADVPIVLAAGDRATASALPAMAEDLRRKGATDLSTEIIANSGHYIADEQPARVSALIAREASRHAVGR
jgi:hypothetical protein